MSGARITGNEEYFSKNFDFFNQIDFATTLKQNIVQLINDRLEHAESFENSIDKLIQSLEKHSAEKAFLHMLAEVEAYGKIKMVMQKRQKHEYHTEAHAAEISHDTNLELEKEMTHPVMNAIASAAAAWHDIIQDLGSPRNEHASAEAFENYLNKQLDHFIKGHPECSSAISHFRNELGFISRELIVYDTWLIFCCCVAKQSHHHFIAKPLLEYADQASQAMKISFSDKQYLKSLVLSAHTIEKSDTRRFGYKEVVAEYKILNQLLALPTTLLIPLENFFNYLHQKNPNYSLKNEFKEIFLGLFGQNIRMFSELNLPPHKNTKNINIKAKISKKDYLYFVDILNDLRAKPPHYEADTNYKKLMDLFINTRNYHGETNLQRSIKFAKAQNCELWSTHADLLLDFVDYYSSLDDSDKNKFSYTLLLSSSRYQPGMIYLKNDSLFLEMLSKELENIRFKISKLQPQAENDKLMKKLLRQEANLLNCQKRFQTTHASNRL